MKRKLFFIMIMFVFYIVALQGFNLANYLRPECQVEYADQMTLKVKSIDLEENIVACIRRTLDFHESVTPDFEKGLIEEEFSGGWVFAEGAFKVYARMDGKVHVERKNGQNANAPIDMKFCDVFDVLKIDETRIWISDDNSDVFELTLANFNPMFIWYNTLLDGERVYLPMYGFFSIPMGADDLPDSWTHPDHGRGEKFMDYHTNANTFKFDWYRIIAMQGESFLLQYKPEINCDTSVQKMGVLGWVDQKNVFLWNSMRYFRPDPDKNERQILADTMKNCESKLLGLVNEYYIEHLYPMSQGDAKTYGLLTQWNRMDDYAKNFGFPLLYPHDPNNQNNVRVMVNPVFPNEIFNPGQKDSTGNAPEGNILGLQPMFLLDCSTSMRDFVQVVRYWEHSIKTNDFGLSTDWTKSGWYYDITSPSGNIEPDFGFWTHSDKIPWGEDAGDKDYKEPLLWALDNILTTYVITRKKESFNSGLSPILFVMANAGGNRSGKFMDRVAGLIRDNGIKVCFIIPETAPPGAGSKMLDTPQEAYRQLQQDIDELKEKSKTDDSWVRLYPVGNLNRNDDFENIVSGIFSELGDEIENPVDPDADYKVDSGYSWLSKSVRRILIEAKKRDLNVYTHQEVLIDLSTYPFESRILMPAKPVNTVNSNPQAFNPNEILQLIILSNVYPDIEVTTQKKLTLMWTELCKGLQRLKDKAAFSKYLETITSEAIAVKDYPGVGFYEAMSERASIRFNVVKDSDDSTALIDEFYWFRLEDLLQAIK